MAQDTIDYAWARPSVSYMKSRGITTVCRYLSWLPNGKVIESPEAQMLLSNGMDIFLNWEFQAKDELGGAVAGGIQGHEAVRQAYNLGYPKGATIYFSGDWDIAATEKPTVGSYFAADGPIVRGAGMRVGAYGGYWYIKYLFDNGLIDDGWQAFAWSRVVAGVNPGPHGQVVRLWDGHDYWFDDRAHMRQIHNGYPFGGNDVDLDERVGPTYSWLHPSGANAPRPTPPASNGATDMFAFKTATAETVYVSDGVTYRGLSAWSDFVNLANSGALSMPAGADPNNRSSWILTVPAGYTIGGLGGRLDAAPASTVVDTAALAAAIVAALPSLGHTLDAAEVQAAVVAALQGVQATFTTKA